jgi:hypothetical protein
LFDCVEEISLNLASSAAAVEASATAAVESASGIAVEAAATGDVAVESSTGYYSAAVSACYCYSAAIAVTVGDWAAVDWASIVAAAISVAVAAVAVTVPGACSDEEATGEPAGAVVSVWRAGVGRVAVVAIGADWRAISVAAVVGRWYANANANRDLGVRETGWEDQEAE